MSRGFVKEEDQEEAPLIPPRAALPAGVDNYVTPQGYQAMQEEKEAMEATRKANPEKDETEKRRLNMMLDGKMRLLEERLATARIVKMEEQPQGEVRFGAKVKIKHLSGGPLQGKTMTLRIVGVDEANLKEQKIAFVAPLAQSLMGAQPGEERILQLGTEQRRIKVIDLHYPLRAEL